LASLIHKKLEKELGRKIYFFEGSPFENDNNNEYQSKIINQIQEHAENEHGHYVILQNLNQVYAFFFDVFNRNFIIKDGKYYARICHGNFSDQLILINEGFKIIILVNKKYLDKVEPPFLNRFEKMILYFSEMLKDDNPKKLAKLILDKIDMKKIRKNLAYNINYELEDLLIGCKLEDILGMIYYELDLGDKKNKDEKNKEDDIIKEKIFKKIYKLLPQDIIINLDNKDELKILYEKHKQYYNLESYINKDELQQKISIIYTFSSITDIIIGIDDSSKFKMISEIKSEIQLNNIINSIIIEKKMNNKLKEMNQNIIFIHFDETNSKHISFLINLVKKDYYKNKDLKFIFIVHIKRNFIIEQSEDEKMDKIFAVADIDTDINQLFIDNLNGPEIKLKEILSNPFQILIEKGLIKIEEEFNKALKQFIFENLKVLEGNDKIINENNYLEKLEDYFAKDKNLVKNIIKKIKRFINEDKELSNNNIIKKIYETKYINRRSIDFITIIADYFKNKLIWKYIIAILSKLEENNVLTTLLFWDSRKNILNDNFNDLVNEIVEKYLDNIKIEENVYHLKFNLNFIIPTFYDFYENLSDFINKNIKNIFIKNEKKIRYFLEETEKINKYDTKENYYKKEEDFLFLVYQEVEKYKFVSQFINKIPTQLLLSDYLTYFLLKKYIIYPENDIHNHYLSYNDYRYELINLMLEIRFDNSKRIVKKYNDNSLELFLIKVNWIEANQDYIIKILNIYDIMTNIFNNKKELIKLIKNILESEKLKYITNEKKNSDITTEVNEIYYKILASICYSIFPPYIELKQKIEIFDYIEQLKKAMIIIKNLNDELFTYSIEVVMLEEFIQIYDTLSLNEKVDYDILNKICKSLKRNNEILCENEEIQSKLLIEEYKNLYDLLQKSLKYTDLKYYDLLKFIFLKEVKKVYDVNYRTEIFNDMIKANEIIVNSDDIFQILFNALVNPKINKFLYARTNLLTRIDFDIAIIIENILENKNDEMYYSLSEALIYFFEKKSFMFLDNIFNSKDKNLLENQEEDKQNDFYGPLKIFKDCIKFLNSYLNGNKNDENKNINLCKLFCIGYIKSFCYTYIKLIDSCSPNLENKKIIISEINNSKSLSKILSLYLWKIIYYKNKQNIDIFIDPAFNEKYKLSEYKNFIKIEKNKNPFAYNYVNSTKKEIYNKFCEILEKSRDSAFDNIKLEDLKQKEIDIDIFYHSTCNLVLSLLKQKKSFESLIYKNFYNNVCIPWFKNKEKIFNAIKILYDPNIFKKFKNDIGLTSDNLNIIFHSYRYFINELSSNSSNNIYNIFYSRYLNIDKINKSFFPGNDIQNLPIYALFSKIEEHFKNIPNQGCFVCFCNKGGYYHSIIGGAPSNKYLNMKCENCGEDIGACKSDRGNINPVKRKNYYKILKKEEEVINETKRKNNKYNLISLEKSKEKFLYNEFKKEKGISKSDENFLKKNTKIVRFLSQVSYRILNFILYSHLLFSKIYNNNDELDIYLPNNMTWIKVITECWEMIKFELKKLGISSVDIFMNYIFSDIFEALNNHKTITEYNELINCEKELDELISEKIENFRKEYSKINNLNEFNSKDKFVFQYLLDERYRELDNIDYPFYNYFYYTDYINEDYILDLLKCIDRDKYPLLLKVLEKNTNENIRSQYSLDNLPLFNYVLNLFNDKYCYLIKRDKANKLSIKDIKDEAIYLENKNSIKKFINFYNSLKLKNESDNTILELSEDNKLSDFFIDDNNKFGKSYKEIYYKFIDEQNNEISELLNNKIEKGIFERNCKKRINIQSADKSEIFITNLPDKFSFNEVFFNCSHRIFAKDQFSCEQIDVDLEQIEDKMTELLLRNKKLFDNSINNFVYANEDLKFENKNIISSFEYDLENIDLGDKIILYKFYKNNEENDILLLNIFNNFIKLIIYLNNNKKLLDNEVKNAIFIQGNNYIYDIYKDIGDKLSQEFKELFNENTKVTISKTIYLFEYFRNLIFRKIKNELKAFQTKTELKEEEKKLIEKCFKNQRLITKEIFKHSIRSFIILFLNLVNDRENNIKENQNNIINYLDIPDIWDKVIYKDKEFYNELNNLKNINIKMNQIISLYDYLGDDINEDFFQDEERYIKKEEEDKKIIEKEIPPNINEKINKKDPGDSSSDDNNDSDEEIDFGDRDYV